MFQAPAGADELGGQPVEQLGMRRPAAQAAEVAGRGNQTAAEMILPDAIHHHAGGERIILGSDPLGQRAPAACGDTAILGQNRGWRTSIRDRIRNHFDESRLHLRTARGVVAALQKVALRRMVRLAGDGSVRSVDIRVISLDALAGRFFVSRSHGGEPVIPIANPHRHRQRLRKLALQSIDFPRQTIGGGSIGCAHHRPVIVGLDAEHLDRQQLLTLGPFLLRRVHGVLNILGERGQAFLEGQLPVGLFDHANLFLQRINASFNFPLAGFVGGYLIGRRQRMIVIDIREEHGHEAVVVGLQDRIELVIVAARAGHRQAEKGARGGADRII